MATHHTPGTARLRVNIAAGTVEITTTETTDTVVNIEPLNRAARDVIDSIKERARTLSQTEHEVFVETPDRSRRSRWFGDSPAFRIEITAPTRSSISVTTAAADVTCTGTCGDVDVRSASGDVSFSDVEGEVTVKTATGDLAFGKIARRVLLQSVSGDVTIRRSSGSATAMTVSGDIRIDDAAPDEDLTSRITLRLPESLKARIESAAASQGVSVNTWLVRAAGRGVDRPTTFGNRLTGFAQS